MQVIIPLAGRGTRLRPHTHLVPKPMLKVAGRPVMDWVMDRLDGLGVTELIFITGHLKDQVEAYARSRYAIPQRFIEQKVQDGTAGGSTWRVLTFTSRCSSSSWTRCSRPTSR